MTENHRQQKRTEKYKFLRKNIIVLSYLPEDDAASPRQRPGMTTVFKDCRVVWCTFLWVSSSGAVVENGQCKRFEKHLFGLLKRASYTEQYKHHTEESASRLHRYHDATCFVRGGEWRSLACAVCAINRNSSIPKPLHSRTCIDPEKSTETHKVSYRWNLIKRVDISLLLKLLTISCCQWEPVCKSNLYSGKKSFGLTRQQTLHTVTHATAQSRCVFSCPSTLVREKLTARNGLVSLLSSVKMLV